MDSFNNSENPTGSTNPFADGDGFASDGFAPSDVVAKASRFSTRGKIIAAVVAVSVAVGAGAAYAMFNSSNVNLYVALGSWFKSDVIDTTVSIQINPDALRRSGASDSDVTSLNLPGVTTIEEFTTGLSQTRLHLQANKAGGNLNNSNLAVSLQYGSANVADLRLVDRVFYLSTDVNKLPEVTPQVVTRKQVDDAKTAVETYGTLLGSDSFAVKLINTIIAGSPASISLKSDTALGKVLDQALAQATAQPVPSMPATTAVQQYVVDALKNSSTITSEGSDSTGNKFLLSVDLHKFAQAIQQGITTADLGVLETYRPQIEEALAQLLTETSGESLQMRAWADSGDLKRIDLDLSQLINLSDKTAQLNNWDVAMRLDIGNSAPAAPSNAVDFTPDFDSLYKGLSALGG
jgi:hypothetical protein